MALFKELPVAFPFYEKKEYQDRFRQNVAGRPDLPGGYTPIELVCPFDAILPFEFYITGNIAPDSWTMYDADNDSFVQALNISFLDNTFLPGVNRTYCYHDGRYQYPNFPTGHYYIRVDYPGGIKYYSEVFHICNFSVLQADCPYLKLQWWNDADLNPIFYNDKVNGVPRFTNVVYLDTFIHEYEPEIINEPETDGLGKPYQGFTLANMSYRIVVTVPGYLKKALVLLRMHDHVFITTAGVEHRTGEIENIGINTESILNGAFSNIEITFEDTFLQKTSCANNMV